MPYFFTLFSILDQKTGQNSGDPAEKLTGGGPTGDDFGSLGVDFALWEFIFGLGEYSVGIFDFTF